MMKKSVIGIAVLFICLWCDSSKAAPEPPHCAQNLFCLFDQEAAASDPAGIHKYSEDLIGSIVPNPAGDGSIRRLSNNLADRLAKAEEAARAGRGKLVSEAAVAKAFNDLMQGIGASSSARTSEASVHGFREHAASIKAFPALFSAGRNGTNCNPGEAVFLLYLMISNDGVFYEKNLDVALMEITVRPPSQPYPQHGQGGGAGAFRVESGPDSSRLLFLYPSDHDRGATVALFNHMADLLGF